jgi:Mrp family chromosome partitioning ATPase
MAESPPQGDGENPEADRPEKKGESDPLFHPGNLKTRKTVMGLAPAPHLGGASRPGGNEAEARKQRVLARIAAMDARNQTGPPPPADEVDAKLGTGTTKMSQPGSRTVSSDGRMPAESGWDMPEQEVEAEIVKQPPPPAPRPQVRPSQPPPAEPLRYVEPQLPLRPSQQPPPRPSQQPPAPRPSQQPPAGVTTAIMEAQPAGPQTERMLHAAPLAHSNPPPAPMHVPVAAPLALRPYEPQSYSRPPPPPLVGPFDPRLVLLGDPHSPRAASFRLLRDTLIGKSMPRVVVVSSPAPKDGKTTCAVNLALAFAELSATRVLLIDGNFFEPELASLFSIERRPTITPPGGTGWLLPHTLVELTSQLHLAAMAKAAAPRFDQQRFDAMIERLVRISYDYIIIDAPAIRGTPAVVQMIASADGTLLAIRSGVSTARDLRRAADQIPANKALGVALIDALPQD